MSRTIPTSIDDIVENLNGSVRTYDDLASLCESNGEHLTVNGLQSEPGSQSDAPLAGPVVTCLASVEPCEVSWLWPGRFALGRVSLIVGRPGEGKSFLTCDMASRVSTGTPWPDGSPCPQGSVLLISAEDDPRDTIRPRLDAHKADVNRIHLLASVRRVGEDGKVQEVMFTLQDVHALKAAVEGLSDCRLIIIDPIGSSLGGRVDSHRDNEVRSVLAPVAQLAERTGAAVVIVAHRRKSHGDTADDMALGSRAFTGLARAVWHVSRDGENPSRRLMLPGKNNLAREGDGLAFSIMGEPVGSLVWEREPVRMSADDALAAESAEPDKPGPDAVAREDAEEWLRELLADAPMPVAKIQEAAKAAGLSFTGAVRRAREAMRIKPYKGQFGDGWYWRLPVEGAHEGERRSPSEITCSSSAQPAHLRDIDAEKALSELEEVWGTEHGAHLRSGPLSDKDLQHSAPEDEQVPHFSSETGGV